jgi:hypothetical protein
MAGTIWVGTRKDVFSLRADASRRSWKLAGPQFLGHIVHHVVQDPREAERPLAFRKAGGAVPQRGRRHRFPHRAASDGCRPRPGVSDGPDDRLAAHPGRRQACRLSNAQRGQDPAAARPGSAARPGMVHGVAPGDVRRCAQRPVIDGQDRIRPHMRLFVDTLQLICALSGG